MGDTTVQFDDRLSAFDYMMFRADMDAHSRTSLMFIETLDEVPDFATLREQIDRASRVVPRLRQRVVAPLLPLAPARWVVDPDFSLAYHLRRVVLPGPGALRDLLDLAEVLHATPLDPGRPLWEATLVEGLDEPDAKAALLWKLSHTVTDGVGGMLLDQMIHQDSRGPSPEPMPPVPVPQDVTPLELTQSAVRGLPQRLVLGSLSRAAGIARRAGNAVTDPRAAVGSAARTIDDLRKLADSAAAEPSPLLRRRGLDHRFSTLDFPLADIRAAAKTHGCSVNDAYLAGIAGAMRIYHERLGVPIDSLNLAMPVNARAGGDATAGNQWSAITMGLPVAEPDVATRMLAIRKCVLHARSGSSIDPTAILAPVLSWLPQQLLAGTGTGSLGIDVQASNVPGKVAERYIAGTRITRSVPIGPLPGVAMMATMVSFAGKCFVGVNYDTAAFSDTEALEQALTAGFDEVLAEAPSSTAKDAAAVPAPARKPAPKPATSRTPARKTAARKAPATKDGDK
ncbi:wax ester/triacylglycerol synthase domain-containing protein [Tomitella gaofuii]|uniref:wax ester/triacylglycerol synthase domain-containing protein n=1 Tax=Tomitella gaofuii TaxID=2760083 RepID=UPI0015FB2552|nr:wax ester/triacylglycerol synthase domain-containing protein [Tomitella gaofuii]